MGIFGFGGISHQNEERAVQAAMDRIGARMGGHTECCENCVQYAGSSETGSKYYGGCRLHQIKVFSNRVCGSFRLNP